MTAEQISLEAMEAKHLDGAVLLSREAGWPHRREIDIQGTQNGGCDFVVGPTHVEGKAQAITNGQIAAVSTDADFGVAGIHRPIQ